MSIYNLSWVIIEKRYHKNEKVIIYIYYIRIHHSKYRTINAFSIASISKSPVFENYWRKKPGASAAKSTIDKTIQLKRTRPSLKVTSAPIISGRKIYRNKGALPPPLPSYLTSPSPLFPLSNLKNPGAATLEDFSQGQLRSGAYYPGLCLYRV